MSPVSNVLRREIIERAEGRCEYCKIRMQYSFTRFEIDHIYAEKHGGETVINNLCLSCLECNRYKGSDLCSLDPLSGEIVSLYPPRRHVWDEHFQLLAARIEPVSAQGRVTIRLLRLNENIRLREREMMRRLHRYP